MGLGSKDKVRGALGTLSCFLLLVLLATPTPAPVSATIITEFALPGVPGRTPIPQDITVVTSGGPAGAFFTENSNAFGNRIGSLSSLSSPTTFAEWGTPTTPSQPFGIAASPNGTVIAFTEFGTDKIGFLRLAGIAFGSPNDVLEFTLCSSLNPNPSCLAGSQASPPPALGPKKIAWLNSTTVVFTESSRGVIGVLNPGSSGQTKLGFSGQATVVEFIPPNAAGYNNNNPNDIAVQQGGIVWFTEPGANRISRLNVAIKQLTQYVVPVASSNPFGITFDQNGVTGSQSVWFTSQTTNPSIFQFDPISGIFTQFPIPTSNAAPFGITIDGSGFIWFTENSANKIGRLNPQERTITEFPLPTVASAPTGIVFDSLTSSLWFVESNGNKVGKLTFAPVTTITTNTFARLTTSTATGSTTSVSYGTTGLPSGATTGFAQYAIVRGASTSVNTASSVAPAAPSQTVTTDAVLVIGSTTLATSTSFTATSLSSTSTTFTISGTATVTGATTTQTTPSTTIQTTQTTITGAVIVSTPITTAHATATVTTPVPLLAIPGFSDAAIAAGLAIGLAILAIKRRTR